VAVAEMGQGLIQQEHVEQPKHECNLLISCKSYCVHVYTDDVCIYVYVCDTLVTKHTLQHIYK